MNNTISESDIQQTTPGSRAYHYICADYLIQLANQTQDMEIKQSLLERAEFQRLIGKETGK